MKIDFSEKLSQRELQNVAQIYVNGKFDENSNACIPPEDWDLDRLQWRLKEFVETYQGSGKCVPEFIFRAFQVVVATQTQGTGRRLYRIIRNIDRKVKGKLNVKEFAVDFMWHESVIKHRGKFCIYYGETARTSDGQRFGGRYIELTRSELARKIAWRYPNMVESIGPDATEKIMQFMDLYAPVIDIDLSERRQNIIFNDGGMIDASASYESILQVGSWSYFSRTVNISSREYAAASDQPQSLAVLAELQVGPNSQGWLACLLEAGGYLIAGTLEKAFVTLQGATSAMKSQIVNIIGSFWPMGAVNAQYLDRFSGNFAFESTVNSAFISFADAPSGRVNPAATALLKQVTGGDYVYVNIKHKTGFTTRLQQPIVVVTNNLLEMDDAAAFSRAINIPFYRTLTQEEGTRLYRMIWAERVSIFKACLRANFARRLAGRPLAGYAPLNSFVNQSYDGTWRQYLPRFINNCVVEQPGCSVSKTEIYGAFVNLVCGRGCDTVDETDFFRQFNACFRAIRPDRTGALCEIRQGTWTGKGLKGFCLDMDRF